MVKIGVCIGTRPELIKCLPLLKSSDIYIPIFVEQHTNIEETEDFLYTYSIKINDYGNTRLDNIISSVLNSTIFTKENFHAIMVQGDTAVAFAAAVAAFHKGIKIIHLEAGLRTYNNENPWPEEGYRKMIDTIASIALCPSKDSANNLRNEHFTGDIHIVGNTSIDAIRKYNLVPTIGKKVIVTLHRRENWFQLKELFEAIEHLACLHPEYSFILPIHPNPDIKKLGYIFKKVNVIDALPHSEMCKLIAECNCIISDSGGIQEEASFMGKRVFCCRIVTERSELTHDYLTFTPTPEDILTKFKPQVDLLPSATFYGDGNSVDKINTYLTTIFTM